MLRAGMGPNQGKKKQAKNPKASRDSRKIPGESLGQSNHQVSFDKTRSWSKSSWRKNWTKIRNSNSAIEFNGNAVTVETRNITNFSKLKDSCGNSGVDTLGHSLFAAPSVILRDIGISQFSTSLFAGAMFLP